MTIKMYLLCLKCKYLKVVKACQSTRAWICQWTIQWEVLINLEDYFLNNKKSNALNLVLWSGFVVDIAKEKLTQENIHFEA